MSLFFRANNQKGSAILPILAMAAVLAGVITGIVSLYNGMSTAKGRTDVRAEADSVFRYAVHLLSIRGQCEDAFRNGATNTTVSMTRATYNTTPPPYPNSVSAFDQLVVNGTTAAPAVALYRTQQYGNFSGAGAGRFQILQMGFRPWFTAVDEVHADVVPPVLTPRGNFMWAWDGEPLTAQVVKFSMRFQIMDGSGGDSLERTQTFVIGYNAAGQIRSCAPSTQGQIANIRCEIGGPLAPVPNPSPGATNAGNCVMATPSPGPPPPGCTDIGYLKGFDGSGMPVCACTRVCMVQTGP